MKNEEFIVPDIKVLPDDVINKLRDSVKGAIDALNDLRKKIESERTDKNESKDI